MNMDKQAYQAYIASAAPQSSTGKNTAVAFVFGGFVCVVAELLFRLYHAVGVAEDSARTCATLTLIAAAALLTAFRVYDRIAKHVGAGLIVPITGFANSVVSPAMEFQYEGYVLGLAAKMFVVAGPVLVYGIVSSVLYGVICFFFL